MKDASKTGKSRSSWGEKKKPLIYMRLLRQFRKVIIFSSRKIGGGSFHFFNQSACTTDNH